VKARPELMLMMAEDFLAARCRVKRDARWRGATRFVSISSRTLSRVPQFLPLGVVRDVADDRLDPLVRFPDSFQKVLSPAANDDLVAQLVEPLRESQPDSGSSACDQDRVASRSHLSLP
jgi:hypothetical protein